MKDLFDVFDRIERGLPAHELTDEEIARRDYWRVRKSDQLQREEDAARRELFALMARREELRGR